MNSFGVGSDFQVLMIKLSASTKENSGFKGNKDNKFANSVGGENINLCITWFEKKGQ